MIQLGTLLKVIDNSGAKIVKCIGVLPGYKQRYAFFGDIITISVQKLRARRRALVKVKKGQVLPALILSTKTPLKESNQVLFNNSVVLLNKQYKLVGTKIFSSLPQYLRFTKFLRLTFLARGLLA